jgi:hypothetical protein
MKQIILKDETIKITECGNCIFCSPMAEELFCTIFELNNKEHYTIKGTEIHSDCKLQNYVEQKVIDFIELTSISLSENGAVGVAGIFLGCRDCKQSVLDCNYAEKFLDSGEKSADKCLGFIMRK